MRILRIEHDGVARYARALDEAELDLLDGPPWLGGGPTGERAQLANVRLLEPVAPSKIVCVGRNYAAHAKELGNDVPSEPLIFLKPPSALLAPGRPIVLPGMSERVEHEGEIGVVIARPTRNVSEGEALEAIFGITCINDVTARDLQRKDVQFTRAKSFDTFCPVGPWIETEIDLDALAVSARVNGSLRQHAPAAQMVFSLATLIAFISRIMTLQPGDLIATGTPEGVGPLVDGDVVDVEVSGVGVLSNPVTTG
jgi:2-keto-4-pentenoate hydratase/2-oxohepta-3-ene-1,7-dioic acid hydratase in catechol pathway